MPERVRSKLIAASLVYVEAEFIEQAVAHMKMTKATSVPLLVMNNVCVGIDTAPGHLMLTHEPVVKVAVPKAAPSESTDPGLSSVNEEVVLQAVKALGSATTRQVGDHLEIDGANVPLRGKVGRMIAKLRLSGAIRGAPGKKDHVIIAKKGTQKARKATPTLTPEIVLGVLNGSDPLPSIEISDKLGLSREDGKARVKVGKILAELLTRKSIEIVEQRGTIRIYKQTQDDKIAA